MGLLKTLFFILLLYYVFKFLLKLLAPFLVKKVADTMQKKAEEQFGNQQPKSSVKEGETTIDKAPKANQQSKNSAGEYVDFEEID
jgi:ABC-type bacteriocin/lantibiotic exporter with double-glycine peptidase domain